MINNYVKLKVLTAPEHKKYSRDQVVCLYLIFLLKQVLSMEEIRQLLALEFSQDGMEESYQHFCARLEGELACLRNQTAPLPSQGHPLSEAVIRSFVYKRYAVVLLSQASE
jgi:DNA-binding transcriptional MerR regulator